MFPTSEADIPPTPPLYSPPCPPAFPASSCHTQLFHSSISPAYHCSVLSLRSSRLSPPRTSHCFFFSPLPQICLSLPVHFPCCFIFLLLTLTFCLYFSFSLCQPSSLSSHPSMSSFPRVYSWEEMSGFCMKCGTSISAKPE